MTTVSFLKALLPQLLLCCYFCCCCCCPSNNLFFRSCRLVSFCSCRRSSSFFLRYDWQNSVDWFFCKKPCQIIEFGQDGFDGIFIISHRRLQRHRPFQIDEWVPILPLIPFSSQRTRPIVGLPWVSAATSLCMLSRATKCYQCMP